MLYCLVLPLLMLSAQAVRPQGQEGKLQNAMSQEQDTCSKDQESPPKAKFEGDVEKIEIDGFEPLEISNFLGVGGFGMVFKTRRKNDPSKDLALKIVFNRSLYDASGKTKIRFEDSSSSQYAKRAREFQKECQTLRDITSSRQAADSGAPKIEFVHCHLMCVGPFAEDSPQRGEECHSGSGNYQFIVMDYFAGEEGFDWLTKIRFVNKAKVAEVLKKVRDALTYLASLQPAWIHHDLKWENILVKDDGTEGPPEVRLIDFGASMSVVAGSQEAQGGRCGSSTLGIAPPEWCSPGAYSLPGYAFDAYSLGAMALESLCDVSFEELQRFHSHRPDPIVDVDQWKQEKTAPSAMCIASVLPLMAKKPEERVQPRMVDFLPSGMTIPSGMEMWRNGFLSDETCRQETMQSKACVHGPCEDCWTECRNQKAEAAVAQLNGVQQKLANVKHQVSQKDLFSHHRRAAEAACSRVFSASMPQQFCSSTVCREQWKVAMTLKREGDQIVANSESRKRRFSVAFAKKVLELRKSVADVLAVSIGQLTLFDAEKVAMRALSDEDIVGLALPDDTDIVDTPDTTKVLTLLYTRTQHSAAAMAFEIEHHASLGEPLGASLGEDDKRLKIREIRDNWWLEQQVAVGDFIIKVNNVSGNSKDLRQAVLRGEKMKITIQREEKPNLLCIRCQEDAKKELEELQQAANESTAAAKI